MLALQAIFSVRPSPIRLIRSDDFLNIARKSLYITVNDNRVTRRDLSRRQERFMPARNADDIGATRSQDGCYETVTTVFKLKGSGTGLADRQPVECRL